MNGGEVGGLEGWRVGAVQSWLLDTPCSEYAYTGASGEVPGSLKVWTAGGVEGWRVGSVQSWLLDPPRSGYVHKGMDVAWTSFCPFEERLERGGGVGVLGTFPVFQAISS